MVSCRLILFIFLGIGLAGVLSLPGVWKRHAKRGAREDGDSCLKKSHIRRKAEEDERIDIQKTLEVDPKHRITWAVMWDHSCGHGGEAYIHDFGPNDNKITYEIMGEVGHGVNYWVEIYGKLRE